MVTEIARIDAPWRSLQVHQVRPALDTAVAIAGTDRMLIKVIVDGQMREIEAVEVVAMRDGNETNHFVALTLKEG